MQIGIFEGVKSLNGDGVCVPKWSLGSGLGGTGFNTLKQKKLRRKSVVHSSSAGQSENNQSTVEGFFFKQVVVKKR